MPEEFIVIKNSKGFQNSAFREYMKTLPDGRYLISIVSTKKRSNPQNDYFHSIVLQIVKEGLRNAGWDWIRTKEDAKDELKDRFLKVNEVNKITGEVKPRTRHTSELTTVEFMEFIADVQKFGAEELGIYVPDPGEALKIDYDGTMGRNKRI